MTGCNGEFVGSINGQAIDGSLRYGGGSIPLDLLGAMLVTKAGADKQAKIKKPQSI